MYNYKNDKHADNCDCHNHTVKLYDCDDGRGNNGKIIKCTKCNRWFLAMEGKQPTLYND